MSQPENQETAAILPPTATNHGRGSLAEKEGGLKKHLKTGVAVFGAMQILCGVMVLGLGITLVGAPLSHYSPALSTLLKSLYPFVGASCFIISGSLSIITEKKNSKLWVQSSLACSVLSTLYAAAGLVILPITLSALVSARATCPGYMVLLLHDNACNTDKKSLTGALSLMLLCSVLELCLAVLTAAAALGWKQARSEVRLPQGFVLLGSELEE